MPRAREPSVPDGRAASRDPLHPIPAGQTMMVYGAAAGKAVIREGLATVLRPAAKAHNYLVRFAGDPIVRERFIHPDWQADPERALRLLQQLWRAEMAPAFADFFPDDSTT